MNVTCIKCGKKSIFPTEVEAWLAGWDLLLINGEPLVTCDDCPSAPILMNDNEDDSNT